VKNQGKTTQQHKDSETFTFIGYLGVTIVTLFSIMSCVESESPQQSSEHNNVPKNAITTWE